MTYSTKKLGEICNFQNGLWKAKKEPVKLVKVLRNTNFKNNDGSLNYDDVAEIEVEEKQMESRLLQKGDIILERSGGGPDQPVGRVVYFENEDGRFSFSNFTTRIRVNGNNLDSKYLWFFLYSFYKSGKTEPMQKKTTGIRNLTFSEYKNIEIPLPPLPEQKKIVAKLESVLGKISEAKKLRGEAQEAAQNLLPSELHKIFKEGKKKGWENKTLPAISENFDSKRRPITRSVRETGEYPYYGASGVVDHIAGYIFDQDLLLISEDGANLIARSTPIAFSVSGKAWVNNHAHVLKFNSLYTQCFVEYFLNFTDLRPYISGSAQPKLNQAQMNRIQIPLPPVAEQKKIVARLDALSVKVQSLRQSQTQTASDFTAIEQSLLQQAFAR